jgi:AcrR family transcriptional regulator
VARKPDPTIRRALRERAVDYVLSHGIADLSLRPLARALRTNARMLVYHFGSRDGLMGAILEGIREREDARIEVWFKSGRRSRTLGNFLRWYWRELTLPGTRSAARLIFELYALALRQPSAYPGVLDHPLVYWRKLVERSGLSRRAGGEEMATFVLAATRGLLLDLTATGEKARVGRAFAKLLAVVEAPPGQRHKPRDRRPKASPRPSVMVRPAPHPRASRRANLADRILGNRSCPST